MNLSILLHAAALYIAPAVDCGHLALGKVQSYAPATNRLQYNCTKSPISQRNAVSDSRDSANAKLLSKVKRNKSSSAADAQCRTPERRLLSERKFQLNRSNPNLWACSDVRRSAVGAAGAWHERRGGSQPSLAPATAYAPAPALASPTASRSARSSTWCCGTFIKQLNKSHHFD